MNAHSKIEGGAALLRVPFAANHISKLPKETKAQIDARKADRNLMVWKCPECGGAHHKNAVHLDYVGHAALTDRLLDADPEWLWEPVAFGPDGLPALDRNGGLWIRLTVCGITRLGYGDAEGKQGGNAVKEAIGDALRNAAMRFGAALDLWHKGDLHAEDDDAEPAKPAQAKASSAPAHRAEAPQEMPPAEYAQIVNLLKATGVPADALLKEYKVKSIKLLNQEQYANAVERLNVKLAEKAKAETNNAAAGGFGELIDDEIPY